MASNKYTISSTDGSYKLDVLENTTNTDTSMTLIGHGMPDYGEDQNTNFLHLLENFASKDEPTKRVKGQIWFRKIKNSSGEIAGTKYELRVCKDPDATPNVGDVEPTEEELVNARWDKIAHVNEVEPTNKENGDLWYDNINHVLKVYDSNLVSWNTIGPSDIVHSVHLFETKLVNRQGTDISEPETGTQYFYPEDLFNIDVNTSEDPEIVSTGSLHLVTLKVIAKEFINGTYSNDVKSCGWLYKFLVQTKHPTEDNYEVSIVGAPTYELLGKTEDTNWSLDVNMSGQQVVVTFDTADSQTYYNSMISVGFDTEIVRV